MAKLTYAQVSALLNYDPETGNLFWKERPVDMFRGENRSNRHNSWNAKFAGKEAFTTLVKGYRTGTIFNHKYLAHRVIWLIATGNWPTSSIDHIDGDGLNNRIENLRDVPTSVNMRNQKMRSDNSSGITGVSWDKTRNKWYVKAEVDGGFKYIGRFESFIEAVAARHAANIAYGFTSRHGA